MTGHPGWPAELGPLRVAAGTVTLRPIRLRDAGAWSRIRIRDQDHLRPWEPTGAGPWDARHHASSWPGLWSSLRSEARKGRMIPLAIELDGSFCGQLTVGSIVRGALRSAWIGYWVAKDVGNRGVATAALALGLDHCFGTVGLHRVEATVRPENLASQAVLRNVGFREEGLLQRYLDVDGAWRDHLLVGMTVEEIAGTVTDRLIRSGKASWA
ncbi:GNAT family N-acetyltransferase [Aldersonia sp. NBC_00410]|uniref:GNAT family N-acetyltransferase n=1 Tax=Aldersonia sp. NBC_00410 TaxID=2975954 RepID=UPI002255E85D|nr:GNAT family protein [Aldersonia sp. NBC_00410]MCX5045561.1 GNAT family N-acetyltransferase [Aldersonia sp. NBC_00410]